MSEKKNYSKYFVKPDMKQSKKRGKSAVETVYMNDNIDFKVKGKKFYIRTYGCQMNVHDSEVMNGILLSIGYTQAQEMEEADLIIFNTCAIREGAESKVFGEIGRLKGLKTYSPEMIFAICGCMSQESEVVDKILETYTWIDLIFGTHNIHRLPELLNQLSYEKIRVVEVFSGSDLIVENLPKKRDSNTKAWVNIIYGCDKFCTYCIVPYTRGKERSRSLEDIMKEVNELVENGYQEITLLGQNVNAYGKDLDSDVDMSILLELVVKTNVPRVRFTTSHPWDFDDKMIDTMAKYDNIIPHIHLPVQSGNSDILKIMGRSYTRDAYLELFDKLKATNKLITVTTDIIVGFPNETEEQFQDTLSLYEYCKFDYAFTFVFSPRENTPAAKMIDNVEANVKSDRLSRLNVLVHKYAKESNAKMLGKHLNVLIEGPSTKNENILAGYSENNKLVLIETDKKYIGKIIPVKIIETQKFSLKGEHQID